MATEETKGLLIARIQARREENARMMAAKKLTRDAPGLFIEETLFTCLAQYCRCFKGVFDRHEELFKPIGSLFDSDELSRLVDQCADEATRTNLA